MGKWQVEKIETKNGDIKKSSKKWIQFLDGGILKGGSTNEAANKEGTYTYDANAQTLVLFAEKAKKDLGEYKVVLLDDTNLEIVKDSLKVVLKRIKE